jgi:hypothetical protein
MDSLNNQSFVLRSELADSQTHLSSSDVIGNNHHTSGNNHSLVKHKSADSAYVAHQDGTPGRDHKISGDELTGGDAANMDDDIMLGRLLVAWVFQLVSDS